TSAVREGWDSNRIPSYCATGQVLHFTVGVTGPRRSDWLSTPVPPQAPLAGSLAPPQDPTPLYKQGPADFSPPIPPGGLLLSQRAEVCWFLAPMLDSTGTQRTATSPAGGGAATPLWTLHRRQRLLLADNSAINTTLPGRILSTNFGLFPEVSCKPDVAP